MPQMQPDTEIYRESGIKDYKDATNHTFINSFTVKHLLKDV